MSADIIRFRPPPIPIERLLAEIVRNSERRSRLQRQAVEHFARLNHWSLTRRHLSWQSFDRSREPIADHVICFNQAMVLQPYAHRDWNEDATDFADIHRLHFYQPPILTASIHAPGHAVFLVFTRKPQVVVWLPEQIEGISNSLNSQSTRRE